MKDLLLQVSGISKSYESFVAVDNVSFDIKRGECLALIGPNGAGKTTISKIIVGLTKPDKGRVVVSGYDNNRNPIKAKEMLGYIPDNPYSYPYLSGRQIFEYMGDLRGISRGELGKRVSELMEYYPLNEVIYGRFGEYSRGNQQKVMIIASLLHNPSLLIIDEPIVGLDTESQIKTEKLLKKYISAGGAVLLSTHTLTFAEKIATDIAVIDKGSLLVSGKIKRVKARLRASKANLQSVYFKVLGIDEK